MQENSHAFTSQKNHQPNPACHHWRGWLAFVERSFEAYRAYYEYLPQGKTRIEYTVRLNNAGDFSLPPTRVEALYAPEVFGAAPNSKVRVEQRP